MTTHPDSNENMVNHQHHAFDDYWRNELPKQLKFIKDPNIKSKAYYADKNKYDKAEAEYVKQLSKNDGDPSDELVLEGKVGKKPGKPGK